MDTVVHQFQTWYEGSLRCFIRGSITLLRQAGWTRETQILVVGVLGLVLVVMVLLPLFLVARRVFAEGRAPNAGTLVLMAITATGLAYLLPLLLHLGQTLMSGAIGRPLL